MNNIEKAFKITLSYLNNLSQKDNFNFEEKDYIDSAPNSVLCNRFNYDKNVLSDTYFIYPILCAIEKAVGELVTRIDPNVEYFNQKIFLLIKMYPDISTEETESDVQKLIFKIKDINIQNLFKFLYDMKQLRNDVSHLRFENLRYKDSPISYYKTRSLLLKDLFEFNEHWDNFRKIALESGRLPYSK